MMTLKGDPYIELLSIYFIWSEIGVLHCHS